MPATKLASIGFLFIGICSYGISHADQLGNRIEDHLVNQMQSQGIPGLAAVVVHNGETLYAEAFGVRNLKSGETLTTEHVLHMASISKTFVATAIAQLVEAGQLSLDAPVVDYLPYFRLADGRHNELSILQLLNHTSGMPDVSDIGGYQYENPEYDDGALDRWVREMDQVSLISEPGQQFGYSDLAFEVLGDVIAKVSGLSFEQYMQTNIFEPLGMEDSSFLYPDIDPELRTTGHVANHINSSAQVSLVYPYNRRHAPSSSLQSSAKDMAFWIHLNLNSGEFRNRRVLSEEAFDLLWEPTLDIPNGPQIGLAWIIVNIDGHRAVMHNGGDLGFRSQIMLFPDENLGFVLATNKQEIDMRAISSGLSALLLD